MVKCIILNPTGNITGLVVNDIQRNKYKEISNKVFEFDKKVEQVGFLKKENNIYRIEMAGLEFCGNASRAFACFLYHDQYVKTNNFKISVSGIEQLLDVVVERINKHKYYSSVKIDYNKYYKDIIEERYVNSIKVNVVYLDGITHILINENDYKFNNRNYKEITKNIIKQLSLNNSAVGVIWYNENKIKPVVWVRDIDSCFYENACGSGSLAYGMFYLLKNKKVDKIDIKQRNNKIITIKANIINNIIKNTSICGETIIGGEIVL